MFTNQFSIILQFLPFQKVVDSKIALLETFNEFQTMKILFRTNSLIIQFIVHYSRKLLMQKARAPLMHPKLFNQQSYIQTIQLFNHFDLSLQFF